MIPQYGEGNVLPPFVGTDDTANWAQRTPYKATFSDLVDRFATSSERSAILSGFLDYREQLRSVGITDAFQWVDGSFIENCEAIRRRPPGDIDVFTALARPAHVKADPAWDAFLRANLDPFDSVTTKALYKTDAYMLDLDSDRRLVSKMSAYWFGVFSHQKTTFRWKGMIELDLHCDDVAARLLLNKRISDGY